MSFRLGRIMYCDERNRCSAGKTDGSMYTSYCGPVIAIEVCMKEVKV